MRNISTFGAHIRLIASNTHPFGMNIDNFADDIEPISIAPMNVKEAQMDLNGNPVSWAVANLINVSISVIPGSNDDVRLGILFNANRASGFRAPKRDDISIIITYPDHSTTILSKGKITSGSPSTGAMSGGRMTSKTYGFAFADMTNVSVRAAAYSILGATGLFG